MAAQPPRSPLEIRKTFGRNQQRFRLRSTWNQCIRSLRSPSSHSTSEVLSLLRSIPFPNAVISQQDAAEMAILLCGKCDTNAQLQETLGFLLPLCEKKWLAFSSRQLKVFVQFLLRVAGEVEAMKILRFVIYEHAARMSHAYPDLFDALLGERGCAAPTQDVQRVSLGFVCLSNLLSNGRDFEKSQKSRSFDAARKVFSTYEPLVWESSNSPNDVHRAKCICAILRVYEKVAPPMLQPGSAELFSLLNASMSLATLGAADSRPGGAPYAPECPESSDHTSFSLSASETNSTNSLMTSSKLRSQYIKIRAASLDLTIALLKPGLRTNGQRVWEALLPPQRRLSFAVAQKNLLSVLLYDPSARVRAAAGRAVCRLVGLTPLKKWLGVSARKSRSEGKPGGFMPLSARTMEQVVMLLTALAQAVKNERVAEVGKAVVEAMEVVAENVEFEVMKTEDVEAFYTAVEVALQREQVPRDSAAKCLDTIMQLHGKLPVVAQWLRASLIDTLLTLSGPGTCSDIYLPTLGGALVLYQGDLGSRLPLVQSAILRAFSSPVEKSRIAGLKCLEALVHTEELPPKAFDLAVNLLTSNLTCALSDSSSAVRVSAHSCMGRVSGNTWARLDLEQRSALLNQSIHAVRTDLAQVRLSAMQALTCMLACDAFADATLVQPIVALCVKCLSDDHVIIRQRAATTVANMCHVQAAADTTSIDLSVLANVVLAHDNDEDKVVAPLVRAMGFLYVLQKDPTLNRGLLVAIVSKVDRGNAKLKWTACNALECIGNASARFTFLDELIAAKLMAVLTKEENFKVRTSALSALRSDPKRYTSNSLAIVTARRIEDCYHTIGDNVESLTLREYQSLQDLRYRILAALCFFFTTLEGFDFSRPSCIKKDISRALRFKPSNSSPANEQLLEIVLPSLKEQP